jgi:hypothetical protein
MCELSLTMLGVYIMFVCLCDDQNLMCNVLHVCEFQIFFACNDRNLMCKLSLTMRV